jgi:acetate CoA/acetoacetate CoA-transferase beta subunit
VNERESIARRVARELRDGMVVNLGIGMPTMVADYVPEGVHIILQSENGMLGMGPFPDEKDADYNLVNAGGYPVTANLGACFFDSAASFGIIRGGHVDLTVLGALQVDELGNLASHIIPGKLVPGMGGAMDLVVGSRRVVAAMTHTAKDGAPKLMRRLTLPATAVGKVHRIVTELAVIDVTPEGFLLTELRGGVTAERVQALTEAKLLLSPSLQV